MCQKRETAAMDFKCLRDTKTNVTRCIFDILAIQSSRELRVPTIKKVWILYMWCSHCMTKWMYFYSKSNLYFINGRCSFAWLQDAYLLWCLWEQSLYNLGRKNVFLMANFNHMTCSKSEWWLQNQVKCMAKNFDKLS